MAAKKGSRVRKTTSKELRLEVLGANGEFGVMAIADSDDQTQLDWITDLAATIKKGPIKYRLIEHTITTRIQSSEEIIEGAGAPKRSGDAAS